MSQIGFRHKGQVRLSPVWIIEGIAVQFLLFLKAGIDALKNFIDS